MHDNVQENKDFLQQKTDLLTNDPINTIDSKISFKPNCRFIHPSVISNSIRPTAPFSSVNTALKPTENRFQLLKLRV